MSKRASKAEYPDKVEWRIPLRGEMGDWYPIIRVGRHIPFGYKQDEDDPDLLIPNSRRTRTSRKSKIIS